MLVWLMQIAGVHQGCGRQVAPPNGKAEKQAEGLYCWYVSPLYIVHWPVLDTLHALAAAAVTEAARSLPRDGSVDIAAVTARPAALREIADLRQSVTGLAEEKLSASTQAYDLIELHLNKLEADRRQAAELVGLTTHYEEFEADADDGGRRRGTAHTAAVLLRTCCLYVVLAFAGGRATVQAKKGYDTGMSAVMDVLVSRACYYSCFRALAGASMISPNAPMGRQVSGTFGISEAPSMPAVASVTPLARDASFMSTGDIAIPSGGGGMYPAPSPSNAASGGFPPTYTASAASTYPYRAPGAPAVPLPTHMMAAKPGLLGPPVAAGQARNPAIGVAGMASTYAPENPGDPTALVPENEPRYCLCDRPAFGACFGRHDMLYSTLTCNPCLSCR
jgi:hypothetical protein